MNSRLCHSPIPRYAAVTLLALVALAGSSMAFCGEIHDAAQSGDLAKVKVLLKDHPDLVFSKDDLGRTPLHIAAGRGHKDVAELLLAHQADVNAKDNLGVTPFSVAAQMGCLDVAELLVAHEADINAIDNHGQTPLHWVAISGKKDAAEWLLAQQADVNAKSDNGLTPLDLAASEGHEDVEELLESAMAAKGSTPAPAPPPAPESTPAPSPSPPILPSQLTASSVKWVSRLSSQCNLRRRKSACRELARVAVEDKDAIVRSAAAANLADQSLLARVAVEDKDAIVRSAAVANLTDQPLLAKIAVEDKDARVRSAAVDSQAGYNSKTGISKAEAVRVLGVFLRDAYNSHIPLGADALARRAANSHLPPGWAPVEQLAATKLANVPIGGLTTLKDFASIDETGYEFTSTRLYCDGRSRDPSRHVREVYFHFDQSQPVRVRFADVRGIKMTVGWSGGETYVYLLSDPGGWCTTGRADLSSIGFRFTIERTRTGYFQPYIPCAQI